MPERYLGKFLGKYRIDELIGSGGFAWVYRGYDPELDIPVALKVLKPQFAGDPTFEERFRREASTAAKLRHPNIVKIYAVGRDGDAVYFAMDYLPSGLADKLETTASLPEEFVIRVGIDVARALGFAHREGVIHRDIKVDNILFDSHGNAVVCDFGIARAVSGYTNQTGTNMVVGTPQYFAPEQARAKPLDGRADIYSLGVSLYRASVGRLPFEGDDWYEIARQHVEDAPPDPRTVNPSLSPAFGDLLLRCLAKHPDDRPATGEHFADELAAILQHSGESTALSRVSYRSPSETPTLITPTTSAAVQLRTRLLGSGVLVSLVALAVVVALVIPIFARRNVAPTTPAVAATPPAVTDRPKPDSLAAARSDTLATGGTLPPDSARRRPADSAGARTTATVGRLTVSAPASARVLVNGVAVGDGTWRADTMRPGTYSVSATIAASAECETATDQERVRIRAGAAHGVTLTPRACGSLQVTVPNAVPGARFTLTSADGSIRREGTFPLGAPLLLPIGSYNLRVEQTQCATYQQSEIVIGAEKVTPLTFRLLCGSA